MASIEFNKTESNSGMRKEIDDSSMALIYDVLQNSIYIKPIDSCVRESVSNAMDSIKEREIAKEILSKKAVISDYYNEESTDISTVDSKFDVEYYDPKYLSSNKTVYITYTENPDLTKRDLLTIRDEGVGLGGKRLAGWTKLGYSSKRLTKKQLGGFGLGCKSPLSTGIESFKMTSQHNGREVCFEVFTDKIDSVYGKWNEDGSQNEFYAIPTANGSIFKAYYKPTDKKNGVEISFDVKKHLKSSYFSAVRNQLSYLKEDIVFKFISEYGRPEIIKVKSSILYEDDNVIIADSSCYNVPHFVMKGITYGVVDFKELELPERRASIGIKVEMEDVDVVPSRESIQYTSKTKQTIVDKIDKIMNIVIDKLNKSLKTDDFFEWQSSLYAIVGNNNNSSNNNDVVMNRIGNLVDKTSLDLKFKDIKGSKSDNKFYGAFLRKNTVSKSTNYRTNKASFVLDENNQLSSIDVSKICLYSGMLSNKQKEFFHSKGYTLFNKVESKDDGLNKILFDNSLSLEEKIKAVAEYVTTSEPNALDLKSKIETIVKSLKILTYALDSKHIKDIDDLEDEIANFKGSGKLEEDPEEVAVKAAKEKKKADRSFLNVKSGSHEFKVKKTDVASLKYIYFLNDNEEDKAFIHAFGINKVDTTNGSLNSTINDTIVVSLAPGNERYVKDSWTKLDKEVYTIKVNDDKSIDVNIKKEYINLLSKSYTIELYKNIRTGSVNFWDVTRCIEVCKNISIIKYNDINVGDMFQWYNNSSTFSTFIKYIDIKSIASGILEVEGVQTKINSTNLSNVSDLDIDKVRELTKLSDSQFSSNKDIFESKLYSAFKAEFDKLITQIYNKIITHEL